MSEPTRAGEDAPAYLERLKANPPAGLLTAEQVVAAEAAARESAWLTRAQAWRVPRIHWDAAFGAVRETEAVRAAREYLALDRPEGRALVLMGDTGVGKTTAAVALLRAEEDARHGWAFFYFGSWCSAVLDPDRRQWAREAVLGSGLLVLDDFGVEYAKAGGLVDSFLDELVWHRDGNRLPTVFTTNLTPDELRRRVSDRVVDRLRGWARIVAATGPSLRGTP